ncbi:MAG: hypothetical protein ACE1ZS_00075 [Candidatus Poribacteria bacterium]
MRKRAEFIMHTDKCVEIRQYNELGTKQFLGWSLPTEVVEELVKWWGEEGNALREELKQKCLSAKS